MLSVLLPQQPADPAPGHAPLSGAVLAGGRGRRLGQDKALLRLWGEQGPTLLQASLAALAPLCQELLVVTERPHEWPALPATILFDRYPQGGALGGIYTALLAARHPFLLVVACDMPFLKVELLSAMAALPRDYDVLIPRHRPLPGEPEGRTEPLHAIYGRPCLEPMRRLLEGGERRIVRFFPQVRVRYLEEEEWARFDPLGRSFYNINTPTDIAEAQSLLRQG